MASFSFAARTILELGKELISSDEVALYELIKNCVDAKAKTIDIKAEIVLVHSDFRKALDLLAGDGSAGREPAEPTAVLEFIESVIPDNASDAQREAFLKSLRSSTGDTNEFEAALRKAYASRNRLSVDDNGLGMSLADLTDIFLKIGTRSRRADNIQGAQYLGDKGVGRLSAMRLGDELGVYTSQKGEKHWHALEIDWKQFSHDREMDISEVQFEPQEGRKKERASDQGTLIEISDLRSDWDLERFRDLLQGKIARMIDPFDAGAANRLLKVYHNSTRVIVPSVPQSLLDSAHATAHGKFYFGKDDQGNDEPVLEGTVAYNRYGADRPIAQRGAEIYSIAQQSTKRRAKRGHAAFQNVPLRPQALHDLGPFDFDIYWFNRRVVEQVPGLTTNSSETREQISQWSGGPMLYRYGFRVLPYGEPSDDWLSLDVVAFGVSGFKLNRQQVIGRVRVQSPHTTLSEQTSRQGLIDSDAVTALKTIMMSVLHVDLRNLINEVDEKEKLSKRDAEERALQFRETQDEVQQAVGVLRNSVDDTAKPLVEKVARGVDTLADQCAALVRRIDEAVKEVTDDREKFVYLAGIGLMTEFIFHELDRSVSHTLKLLVESQKPNRDAAIRSLHAQLVTLQKRISAFDEMTGEKRQSKTTFDLADLVEDVLQGHANELERHDIQLHFERKSMPLKAVRGMVVQILENLLANSLYWLKQQARYKTGFKPELRVSINPDERTLTVEDNGPGVAAERKELIFQPFITSKPAAQGRGLGLYISRELAQYHDWQLYLDPSEGRRGKRLNLFVLDMGG